MTSQNQLAMQLHHIMELINTDEDRFMVHILFLMEMDARRWGLYGELL